MKRSRFSEKQIIAILKEQGELLRTAPPSDISAREAARDLTPDRLRSLIPSINNLVSDITH